jgi:hypothetical protein
MDERSERIEQRFEWPMVIAALLVIPVIWMTPKLGSSSGGPSGVPTIPTRTRLSQWRRSSP